MSNPILKQDVLKRLSTMEPQVIQVQDGFDSLRDLNVNARVVNKNPGINEVRLPFDLTAAQTGQNAIRLDQPDASLRQPNAVTVPKRKLSTDEIWIVKDSVKPVRLAVRGILVALGPKERSAKAQVIVID
jgi:hypothetical protein